MITHHLDVDVLHAYARDLISRLEPELPDVWIMLGLSGTMTLKSIASACKDQLRNLVAVQAIYNRNTKTVEFINESESDLAGVMMGRSVIIVDSTVNSGETLLAAINKIKGFGPKRITTYAITVKASARLIPNYFSILVGAHDRVLFVDGEDSSIQNNRFMGYGIFRRLQASDLKKPMLTCKKGFIDRTTWSDHWYEIQVDSFRHCFLFEEDGDILGFISYRCIEGGELQIDEIAVDYKAKGKKIGHDLMRWVETHARNMCCHVLTLWSVEEQVGFYEKHGYQLRGKILCLDDDGNFQLMVKPLL